jgi:hypothetical protein
VAVLALHGSLGREDLREGWQISSRALTAPPRRRAGRT